MTFMCSVTAKEEGSRCFSVQGFETEEQKSINKSREEKEG